MISRDAEPEGRWLPDLTIAIAEPFPEILDRMVGAARTSRQFGVDRQADALERFGLHGVNFRWLGASVHDDLCFQAIGRPETPSILEIEVRAHRWGEDPLTAQTYVAAARALVAPLLKTMSDADGGALKLRVERRRAPRFRMTARSRRLLDRFAHLANARALHPLDWRRFYDLVAEGRQVIPAGALRSELLAAGFAAEKAEELAALYEHLWAFKRRR